MNVLALSSRASGVSGGTNPDFTEADFRRLMPAFSRDIVDDEIVRMYVHQAHAVVKHSRWKQLWIEGMRLYVAHFLTLYITTPPEGVTRDELLNASRPQGAVTGKSVENVSVSYDVSPATGDLAGWASWKTTEYGTQFATLARTLTKAGMYVR